MYQKLTAAKVEARTVQPSAPEADRLAVRRRAASRGSLKVALFNRSVKGPSRKTA